MKPSGKFFVKAMRKYGLRPSDCLVVGDDYEKDILPAKRLGIKTIVFRNKKRGADYSARSYGELMRIMKWL